MSRSSTAASAPVLDDLLGEAAVRAGGIQPLLTAFFGFLSRRTDFYLEAEAGKPSPLGFPPGVAQRMVLEAFNSYPYRDVRETPQYKEFLSKSNHSQQSSTTSPTRSSSSSSNKPASPSSSPSKTNTSESRSSSTPTKTSSTPEKAPASSSSSSPASTTTLTATTKQAATSSSSSSSSSSTNETALDYASAATELQRPIGNGGVGPGYSWTQTLNDITVYVDLEPGVKRSDVTCSILTKRLHVELRAGSSSSSSAHNSKPMVLISGELEDVIKPSESMWTMTTNTGTRGGGVPQLTISLDKARKTWWRSVVLGDPQIDTTMVDSTQNIDEYDEATQATIRKLMFEQKQKRLMGQLEAPPDLDFTMSPGTPPPLQASLAALGLDSSNSSSSSPLPPLPFPSSPSAGSR